LKLRKYTIISGVRYPWKMRSEAQENAATPSTQ